MTIRTFPTNLLRGRTRGFGLADAAVLAAVFGLLAALAALSEGLVVPFGPGHTPTVSTDPANLPYYAGRSLLRMFIALGASTLFAIAYGYATAKSRRAARVLVPLLDVLQSVPVLGFLSITVTGFIALFPGSLLGLELASIFAIFTAQAWNMAFSAYHSFLTVPRDLDEAARMYHLSSWQRLRRIELPAATVGLVWNGMMSMGGGWFFLVASEAITVNNASYTLPGIGSFVGQAISERDYGAVAWAILTMIVIVVAVDRLFWRPLVAWSERFKLEESASGEVVESAVLNVLRRSRLVALVARTIARAGAMLVRAAASVRPHGVPKAEEAEPVTAPRAPRVSGDLVFNVALALALAAGAWALFGYLAPRLTPSDVVTAFEDGLFTFVRVIAVVAISALIWTPIGVWIGMNPRVSRIAQPIVQVAASFPANFIFPVVTVLMLRTGFSIELGAIPLMALGTQWYILFNTIAGAMGIPNDLREASALFRLPPRVRWRKLILPAIFPAWVTGAITAAGGAWNASIVAEIVSWGPDTLRAHGLGAYIAAATAVGDFPRTFLGIGVMVLFVVGLNRLVWHRLYRLAESRYRLG